MRLVTTDATTGEVEYTKIPRVDEDQVLGIGEGEPAGYWVDFEEEKFFFDSEVSEESDFEAKIVQFSEELSADADTHPLLDVLSVATQIVLPKCVVDLGPAMRQPKLVQIYQTQLETHLKTFMNYQIDLEFDGGSGSMAYGEDYSNIPGPTG